MAVIPARLERTDRREDGRGRLEPVGFLAAVNFRAYENEAGPNIFLSTVGFPGDLLEDSAAPAQATRRIIRVFQCMNRSPLPFLALAALLRSGIPHHVATVTPDSLFRQPFKK